MKDRVSEIKMGDLFFEHPLAYRGEEQLIKRIKSLINRVTKRKSQKIKELRDRYPQYKIGRGTYGDPQIMTWEEGADLTIGAFCSFAKGVKIFLGGEHRIDWVTTYPFNILWDNWQHI
ncbi:MAG: hypothetical protein HQK75_19935, partial [Candidatus Magnetomorum sp.]|nr:hypothetical protein [Candidatus Magnetomorum sp.]